MSITGVIVFFTGTDLANTKQALAAVMDFLGVDSVQILNQHSRQYYSWLDVVDDEYDDDSDFGPVAYMNQLAENPAKHDTRVPYEETLLLSDCTAEEAAAVIKEDLFYEIYFRHSSRIALEMDRCVRKIPEAVRDSFLPCSPSISIGPHDIFDAASEPPQLFGHARFSVGFFGYGAPHDWNRYRELIFDIPFIKKLQIDLETIVGPLEHCAYWEC